MPPDVASTPTQATGGAHRHAFPAMGTWFEIVLAQANTNRANLLALAEETEHIVKDWNDRLTAFEKTSDIARVNCADGAWTRIDGDVLDLLEQCLQLTEATGGAFDIALRTSADPDDTSMSPAFELDSDRAATRIIRKNASLDLGGVAKGLALDHATAFLRSEGVTSAFLQGGSSSIATIGAAGNGEPWRVQLDKHAPVRNVPLEDLALAVSAADGSTRSGKSHVINPRTGTPAPITRRSATVGPSAMLCDAWSTALLVLESTDPRPPADYDTMRWDIPEGECKSD